MFSVCLAVLMAAGTLPQIFAESLKTPEDKLESYSPEQIEQMISRSDATVQSSNIGNTLYIYDISSATADTFSEAKSLLNNAGYVVLDQDMNEGSDGGRCCLIGYKLTTDREKALTSLYTMEMSGGYEFVNYRDFLVSNAHGLEATIDGFIASCKEMKRLVNEQNQMAMYAYDTLNLLCVPENSMTNRGVPLGEYLISDSTSREDIKTLILVCQADILSFINNLLATACSECRINVETDERVAYVSDPDWIKKAVVSTFDRISVMTSDESDRLKSKYAATAGDLSASIKNAGALETRFLDEIIIRKTYKNPQGANKVLQSVYDMLISGEPVLIGCFIEALPETITADNFIDVLEDFVDDDEEQKIPKKVAALPGIVSPWMRDMVDNINANPYDHRDVNQVNNIVDKYKTLASDNDLFIYSIKRLIDTYRKQDAVIQQIMAELGESTVTPKVVEAYDEKIKEINENKAQGEEPEPEYLFYSGAYMILKNYKIAEKDWLVMKDGTKCSDLAEYFELIADATGKEQEALAFAFTSALSDFQRYNAKSVGISTFIINGLLLHSDSDDILAQYEENKRAIVEAYAKAGYADGECSIWFDTSRDLLDVDSLAMTSAAKRLEKTNNDLLGSYKSLTYRESVKKNISQALEITGIAMGVAGVLWAGGAFGIYLISGVAITSVSALVDAAAGLGAAGAALSTAGLASAILGLVGFIFFVVLAVAMIILLILGFTYDISDEYEIEYTEIPTTMLDCELDANNAVAQIMRYDVVRDVATGKPADLNDMDESGARRWLALYYSADPVAGSPLVVCPDNDTALVGQVDDMTIPDKAVPVAKFGSQTPYNMNAYDSDADDAVYLFYYSENSVIYKSDKHTPGKYLYDLKLSIAKSEQMAKNYIGTLTGYSYLDYNLTPDTDYYTYLGYSTTNNENYAVTDIRADYASPVASLNWGDSTYISVFDEEDAASIPLRTVLPQNVESTNEGVYLTEFYFNIYFSRSHAVGDPILASTLSVFNSLSGIRNGYEYIRWFSGGAFDFLAEHSYVYDHEYLFVSFAPEEDKRVYKTADSVEYLAGIAFFVDTASKQYFGGDYIRDYFRYTDECGYKVLPTNLSLDMYDYFGGMGAMAEMVETGTYLLYSVTINPKKAITDIGSFTGEAKGAGNLSSNIASNGIGFEAAHIFKQYSDPMHPWIVKINLRPSHAYFTKVDAEVNVLDAYWYGENKISKPRALYTAGPQSGLLPLRVSDVLYSQSSNDIPKSGKAVNVGLYSLGSTDPIYGNVGTGWRSVHAIEQYFYDEYDENGNLLNAGTNLGLSYAGNSGAGCELYLYFRNTRNVIDENGNESVVPVIRKRGAYIASAEIVGSLSYAAAYDEARLSAMAHGQEIINFTNPLYTDARYRYDVTDENVACAYYDHVDEEYSDICYYIVVRYQNTDTDAVASIRVAYQSAGNPLPATCEFEYNGNGKTAIYKKGQSLATTIRPEKESDDGKQQGNKPGSTDSNEGYVLYCATHTGQASRIVVLEDGLCDRPFHELGRRFAERFEGGVFSVDGNFRQVIALYSPLEEFISGIMLLRGGTREAMEIELGQRGYTQVIYYDVMSSATGEAVMLGIMRQSSPIGAIQDIKVSATDRGEKTTIDNLTYFRVNSESIASSESTNYSMCIYYTTGVRNSVKTWGGRTAITNLGISYIPGNTTRGKTITYWNGQIDYNIYPASSVGNVHTFEATDETGKTKSGYLNKTQFDETYADINFYRGSERAQEFLADNGYTWISYMNSSGFTYSQYAKLYKQGRVTGTAEGDANLQHSASQINTSPTVMAAIIGISVAVLAGAGLIVFVKTSQKRKKDT